MWKEQQSFLEDVWDWQAEQLTQGERIEWLQILISEEPLNSTVVAAAAESVG